MHPQSPVPLVRYHVMPQPNVPFPIRGYAIKHSHLRGLWVTG